MINILRNALFKKDNDYLHLNLTLSTGHVLEDGTFSVKWMRDFHHKNKHKLISNFRMSRNVAYVDNLRRKKLSPVLALFNKNLTVALENEYREKQQELGCSFKRLMSMLCSHF